MIKQNTTYGIKILLGQWRANELSRALEKIVTNENFIKSDILNCGEFDTLKLLYNCIKEKT